MKGYPSRRAWLQRCRSGRIMSPVSGRSGEVRGSRVIRVYRTRATGFTMVPNALLRDPNLSLRARGLLVQLLSHEDGWQQSVNYALQECGDGRDSIRSGLQELEAAGYLRRSRRHGPSGKWLWDHEVQDVPIWAESPSTVEPSTVEPSTVKASIDKEALDEEPLDEEPHEVTLASTASKRASDPIFELLFNLDTGRVYSTEAAKVLTSSARGSLNRAARDIKATDISPADLLAAIGAWGQVMGEATCTANAVAKHLPRLLAASEGHVARMAQPSDEERVLNELRQRRERKEAMRG